MRRLAALVVVACCLSGCGSSATKHRRERRAVAIGGGCGTTTLQRGMPPGWTAPAFGDSSTQPPGMPFGLADHGDAVAVLFGYPLRAGNPENPSNKVLWIMRLPRRGSPLIIRAQPLGGGGPTVRGTWPADASPGEIYPSYVNVPRAGCWRLTLSWAGHSDAIDLAYRA